MNDGLSLGRIRYSNTREVKRQTAFQGIPISVEIDVGDYIVGNGWAKKYYAAYGEIPNSATLADGEGVDVYLGPDQESDFVFVVHQNKRNGTYDEDKVFLAFSSERDALKCYFDHGPEWGFGSLDTMTVAEFKNGYLASNRVEMVNKGEGGR